MASYKNILVAVDLGEEAFKILEKVKPLLAEGGKVSVVHVGSVLAALFPVSSLGGSGETEKVDALQKEYVGELKTYLNHMAEKSPVPIDQKYVELGKVSTEVLALAKKLEVDLIVVGQHSGKKVERLLGSSANAILHSNQCDVLTVNL